ncbi:MAG: hypothetical protein QXU98_08140 [Candidatus Parvarchaeota archaeon]
MDIEWQDLAKDTEEEALKKQKENQIKENEAKPENKENNENNAENNENLMSGGLGELIISLGNILYNSQGIPGYTDYDVEKIREFSNSIEAKRHIKIPAEIGLGVYAISPLIRKWTADLKAKKENSNGSVKQNLS